VPSRPAPARRLVIWPFRRLKGGLPRDFGLNAALAASALPRNFGPAAIVLPSVAPVCFQMDNRRADKSDVLQGTPINQGTL
jgi:hypothetical protein